MLPHSVHRCAAAMLEERVTFPQRLGSARSGCGSSRVVSARAGAGRIGSARPSSDTRRPKLHTGRPSSAPPGHTAAPSHPPSWPAARVSGPAHTPHRTHDVTHLNLRVEGKSVSVCLLRCEMHHNIYDTRCCGSVSMLAAWHSPLVRQP